MRVPRGARTRRERDARTDGACRIVRLDAQVNTNSAGKPLRRSFGRRLRAKRSPFQSLSPDPFFGDGHGAGVLLSELAPSSFCVAIAGMRRY